LADNARHTAGPVLGPKAQIMAGMARSVCSWF
jgi:hypothetical protein